MSKLLDFYCGSGADHAGRSIIDIWNFTDEQLEKVHDYIQWIFPSDQPSMFLKVAPLATPEDYIALRTDAGHIRAIRNSLGMMHKFYGIGYELVMYDCAVQPKWFTPNNHNFSRLTRIMTFLKKVGFHSEAGWIHGKLISLSQNWPDVVSERSLYLWGKAMETEAVRVEKV